MTLNELRAILCARGMQEQIKTGESTNSIVRMYLYYKGVYVSCLALDDEFYDADSLDTFLDECLRHLRYIDTRKERMR